MSDSDSKTLGDLIPGIDPSLKDIQTEEIRFGSKTKVIFFTVLAGLLAISSFGIWKTIHQDETLAYPSETLTETNSVFTPSPAQTLELPKSIPASYESVEREYIVRKGDWLSRDICPNDWQAVAELNQLSNPNLIYPGQKIQLLESCVDVEEAVYASTHETSAMREDESEPATTTVAEDNLPTDDGANAIERTPSRTQAYTNPIQSVPSLVRNEYGAHECKVDLPEGVKAFQWSWPGRQPIGEEDPDPYLEALAKSEGLPDEARAYFLAELQKGKKGAYGIESFSWCQYVGAMAGKMMYGKIPIRRHTVINWNPELHRTRRTDFGTRKQTKEEALENDKARRYEFVVGNDRWVLLRANICGNLILRREVIPSVQETAPKEPEPTPIPSSPPITGTCVPRSHFQDCAMPGCVSRVSLLDATPACAASCESAPEMNSNPVALANRMHPVVDGICSLSDARPNTEPLATFTVLGGALIAETDPIKICQMTPDVEYRGLQLVCLADGTVRRGD